MKAKVLVKFRDKKAKVIREIGNEFEVSEKRFTDINKTAMKLGYETFIEEIEEDLGNQELEEKNNVKEGTKNK
ncbi:hypothetical protein NSA24_11825 [Clostridioides mangenotii]|uniref:hypothetical protein n=1 Tax=Metaclostridioides mangenotii TaxID=1540 RepID=UPI002149A3D2|nr:hypothetical protein [Clostridioides mangenotii]MCR1955483.1 hypothetical protein [Clostridioides mangenotii]